MPFDTLRKRLSTDSSSGSKKKEQLQPQRLAQHDQAQRSPKVVQHAFANVVNQVASNRTPIADQRASTSSSPLQSSAATSISARGLAPDVYRKIKEVDQETSTLTASGASGLSARIIDKYEFTQPLPDGTLQTYYCQTVEILKRPGQSLGLYLREGNGEDRFDGVFVSRLQDESELRNSGVLWVGDEIMTVNKVNVTQRNIDEVVVMISIPRRLLLQTRTVVKRPGFTTGTGENQMATDFDNGKFIKPIGSSIATVGVPNKPIAIIKQLPRDESRESTATDDGAPLASSQLMATAQTSLGVKARAQESITCLSNTKASSASAMTRVPMAIHRSADSGATSVHQSRPRERHMLTQRSFSDRWNANKEFEGTQATGMFGSVVHPYASASTVEQIGTGERSNPHGAIWRSIHACDEATSSNRSAGYQSTLASTAYLPPPRLQSHLPTLERASLLVSGGGVSDSLQSASAVPLAWNPSTETTASYTAALGAQADSELFSPRSVASDSRIPMAAPTHNQPLPPRSALRQPSAFPTSIFPSIKSNSLPRRHTTGRTIRWRNDVLVDTPPATAMHSTPAAVSGMELMNPVEASDSDGAVSAPELVFAAGCPTAHNPHYILPTTPSSGKTIDDIFSRAEYRAWEQASLSQHTAGLGDYAPIYQFYGSSGAGNSAGYFSTTSADVHHWHGDPEEGPSSSLYATHIPSLPPIKLERSSKSRSSSLPPRGLMVSGGGYTGRPTFPDDSIDPYAIDPGVAGASLKRNSGEYTLDVSPLPRRRLPLSVAAANPTFGYAVSASEMPIMESGQTASMGSPRSASLTGILLLRVIEGRQIRSREPEEMYCVVEVDGEHRARTEVSDWHSAFHWNEMFEIDVWECRRVDFYIYSWHPQYRHRLRHRAFLQLMDTLLEESRYNQQEEEWNLFNKGIRFSHSFALNLDPRGQLFIQVGFQAMPVAYRRRLATRRSAYWAVPLQNLVEREASGVAGGGHVPTVLRRLIQEIERRGVDTTGLYVLCGSSSKKQLLKDQLEREAALADLSPDAVPDLNVLTSVLKDFLRELPEPLVPNCLFQMLLEAWKVCVPNDKEGNAKLMLGVIDCLPRTNKCTFMVLMDHLKYVISQSPHNGLSSTKCGVVFGPLVFCTSQAYPLTSFVSTDSHFCPPKPYFTFLDHRLAARLLELLLELWPSPRSSSESSGSENSTMNLTGNGNTSLVDLWLQENRFPESNC